MAIKSSKFHFKKTDAQSNKIEGCGGGNEQRSEVTIEPTTLNGCQHLASWALISTHSCRLSPPVSWHFLIFLTTSVWRLRACVSTRSQQNPPNKQEISPRSLQNRTRAQTLTCQHKLWADAHSYGCYLTHTRAETNTPRLHLRGLVLIYKVLAGFWLSHALLTHFTAFLPFFSLPPHPIFFFVSPEIYYPPSLFLPFHMPSPPLLVLPSSSFLLLSSKFSCVIPSPRTPLISPLPACLRNTGRAMREQRGGEGRRGEGWPPGGGGSGQWERGEKQEGGERKLKRERKERKSVCLCERTYTPPTTTTNTTNSGLRRKDTGFPRDHIFCPSFWSTENQESSYLLQLAHNGHSIYFPPFSFCQGPSSVRAKDRNLRCFTKDRRPPPFPLLLLPITCMRVFSIYLQGNQTPSRPQSRVSPSAEEILIQPPPPLPSPQHRHVGTFICDLPSILPPGQETHTLHRDPLLWHRERSAVPSRRRGRWPSVPRRAHWPNRSSLPPVRRWPFAENSSLAKLRQKTAAHQENQACFFSP